jgi:hypothetical protein
MFITSVGTFLISKDFFYVLKHEFYAGIGVFDVHLGVVKIVNPSYWLWIDAEMAKDEHKQKAI